MKKRELEAMRKQDTEVLMRTLDELHDKLMKVQIDMSIGQEKNLAKARNIRRDIAQAKTIIRDKQSLILRNEQSRA